jgi:RNA polymerase sigma-70 factor, ECF subfamily
MPVSKEPSAQTHQLVDTLYREESGRVLATLIRLLGDFDIAEEALHDAFAAAVTQWPSDGIPANPRAWLVSTGRFKAIDAIRRRARFDNSLEDIAGKLEAQGADPSILADDGVKDDHLRLIFTCCHPALAPDARIALTLRTVCGLTTEEIAAAFLTATPTIAQRIVRAKAKIKAAGIPYELPASDQLAERLDTVLRVIYLVFNEGYSASSGETLTRVDLSSEAIRLARRIVSLMPDPEARGLLGLMLIHESRREARTSANGDMILLKDQDRSLWNREYIVEGGALVEDALGSGRVGPYMLQGAIAALHAEAEGIDSTDWPQIVGLYDVLMRIEPSPVVELNRAVALAMRDGPEPGLTLIDAILARGELVEYQPAHAARADLLRRLDRLDDARMAYLRALSLTAQEPQRRFLEHRLKHLDA